MKWALALVMLLWCAIPAVAQQPFFFPVPLALNVGGCPAQGPYTGPGDIVSGADGWWGIRAYSLATTCSAAIRIERHNDGTGVQIDINTLPNGNLNVASVNGFAGVDATCTGTISGTTLSVSSCSGTPQARDTLTGVGITQPAYIASIGTCASPPGTCTLNASQTVASPETITIQAYVVIVTFYDQSGALLCSAAACPATIGHVAAPALLPDCGGGIPCVNYIGGSSTHPLTVSTTWPNQPLSVSAVGARFTNTTLQQALQGYLGGSDFWAGWSAANTAKLNYGASLTATASDSALHAFQFVANGASSAINVDGTATTGNAGASNPGTQQFFIGQDGGTNNGAQFYENEVGIWPIAFSGTQQTNLCHNQFVYWGTATSC